MICLTRPATRAWALDCALNFIMIAVDLSRLARVSADLLWLSIRFESDCRWQWGPKRGGGRGWGWGPALAGVVPARLQVQTSVHCRWVTFRGHECADPVPRTQPPVGQRHDSASATRFAYIMIVLMKVSLYYNSSHNTSPGNGLNNGARPAREVPRGESPDRRFANLRISSPRRPRSRRRAGAGCGGPTGLPYAGPGHEGARDSVRRHHNSSRNQGWPSRRGARGAQNPQRRATKVAEAPEAPRRSIRPES